ncbi:MAG TPA: DUF4390 domain-containing protein [Burkholderiaceae bacterium]|jgi:hypothetical protein|nr:DUF4390 domain-containing protein [Burkholderiaceae bacterium]HRZ01866.1 DUF4390 domain-containing protein [Burkholderiaceae bacterium]
MSAALRLLRACLAALALGWLLAPVHADERIGLMAAALEPAANGETPGIYLNATFEFELPPALDEALHKGIALYFVIEFDLYRERWWWFNRKAASAQLVYRLSYSPLTRQYRLARGGLSQPFDSLEEVLALLKSVRNWRVLERGVLKPGEDYVGEVRMRLDTSQLPKPFQVNALANREWNLSSDWQTVRVPPELAR